MYIANAHLSAHYTQVKVLSDIEYRGNSHIYDTQLKNIIFIGGPNENKIFKKYCSSYDQDGSVKIQDNIHCHSPVEFLYPIKNPTATTVSFDNNIGYKIGTHVFHNKDTALIFTLPLYRDNNGVTNSENNNNANEFLVQEDFSSNTAYAMCLHASTVEGYMALGRLSWHVVPPMVRSPFSNYLPDFLVLSQPAVLGVKPSNGNSNNREFQNLPRSLLSTEQQQTSIWNRGFGSVLLAGYWGADWKFDESNAYFMP